ncbi:MAG: OprD family outer membrane porin [Campylobacterota bacterium]|nr:OprD family outer membrane porin [Campylobacterota bacterium]
MKIKLSIVALLTATSIFAGEEIKPVEQTKTAKIETTDSLADAFKNGKVSGEVRAGYIQHMPKLSGEQDRFSTTLGGQLKYETGKFYGFDFGVAFYTSHAINELSGEKERGRFNDEMSSADGHYDLLAEAYLDYSYRDFKIRGGRQLIDTPYADSDDIRMTPNTFEGVVATYTYSDFSFIGAYLTRWQGPGANEYKFIDLLDEGNGVTMAASTYTTDTIEVGLWYYGADKTADVIYADAIGTYVISGGVELKGGLQFANQSERENSGFKATLYGAMAEIIFSGATLGVAYDALDVDEGKKYFGGFGGGVGFVNMDEYTAGTFTLSQSGDAWKVMAGYDFAKLGLSGVIAEYHYGEFTGDNYGEVIEQNIVLAYAPSKEWDIELVYITVEDKNMGIETDELGNPKDTGLERLLVRANYHF